MLDASLGDIIPAGVLYFATVNNEIYQGLLLWQTFGRLFLAIIFVILRLQKKLHET